MITLLRSIHSITLLLCCLLFPFFAHATVVTKSHGYAIFSTLKYPANFTHFEYANPDAPKRGQFRQAHIGTFNSVNAHTLKGAKAPGLENTYDSLLVKSSDELNSYYGLVAETIEYPDDLSYVIFNLRPEAKWHNGGRITADDLVFTFNTLKEKGDPNYRIILGDVKEARKLSEYRVQYIFNGNDDPLQIVVIGELPILQKKFFQDKAFDQFDDIFPTSGPYRIKDYGYGKHITLERVDDYWAKDLPVNKGLYNFDILQYDCYHETVIAVEAFKAGALDYREENVSQLWATAYNGRIFSSGRAIREERQHKLPANLQAFFFNLRKPELQDVALRKAIYYAYDFDWMNQNLFYNVYQRTKSYFDHTPFASSGVPEGEEWTLLNKFRSQLPAELFDGPFEVPSSGSDPMKTRYYLRFAKQILLDAGYKIKGDKLISPITGKPVELEMIYHFQGFERMILAFKDNLAKIGITLVPRLIDYAQYLQRMEEFEYDMATWAFVASTFPGRNQIQIWHSSSDVKGGFNMAGVHSAMIDDILEHMVSSKTESEVITYARALDRILLWNYYAIPQMHSRNYRVVYWNLFGIPTIRPDYALGTEAWWQK